MNILKNYLLPVLALIFFVLSSALFTVSEYDRVVLFRLGEIVKTDFTPGLHFKLPFLTNIKRFDGRLQAFNAPPERYLTSEKKNVIVDAFIQWRIGDVATFYRSTRGDDRMATLRLTQIVRDGMKNQFSSMTVSEAVSGARGEITERTRQAANVEATKLGIEIVAVRILRIDLPPEVSESVYRRMEKERATVARGFRSRGEEQARRITADADRQREEILAEAYSESQIIRGQGDAKAAATYTAAFSQDPEFFDFYRSLQAYSKAFADKSDVLVLQPDSDFFRYFNSPTPAAPSKP
ncbi:MAG: HflC protein [Gammaproteobacteria bacterium 28-57-27]|nr:MAG: HflC protein [Gammaproteobacteria bacterium 28-57-27]